MKLVPSNKIRPVKVTSYSYFFLVTAHPCRTTYGNYINCMHCPNRLLDAHTPAHHHAITSISVSLIYSPSCLRQETAKWPYGLRVAATYVNHTNAKFSHGPFNAERQAEKLWIPIFIVFWYGSTRKWTPVYRLQRRHSYHYTITAQSSVAKPTSRNAQTSINKTMTALSSKHLFC